MKAGQALLALCAWVHFALLVWACFLLPTHGDWLHKLESASNTPLLLPLMVTTSVAGWLCREWPPMLLTATTLAGFDLLIWSSRCWL